MTPSYRESGFTLLEIIVVMVIVATLATLAALSIGSLGRHDDLERAAKRIVLAVDLGAEEAALSGYPIGLDLGDGGYNFQIFREGEWQLLQRGKLFERYEFGSSIELTPDSLDNSGESLSAPNEDSAQPTIVLLPDGERWLSTIALYDSNTGTSLSLLPSAGHYQIETTDP